MDTHCSPEQVNAVRQIVIMEAKSDQDFRLSMGMVVCKRIAYMFSIRAPPQSFHVSVSCHQGGAEDSEFYVVKVTS